MLALLIRVQTFRQTVRSSTLQICKLYAHTAKGWLAHKEVCSAVCSGRNCVWLYNVHPETGLLSLASQNRARREHDGPRHTWPHPNGQVVYSLQEHSSVSFHF